MFKYCSFLFNKEITGASCPEMHIKILILYLALCGDLPWSACNPYPISTNGNVAQAMDETRELNHDIHRGNKYDHSLKDMDTTLRRRSGNPGMTLAKTLISKHN